MAYGQISELYEAFAKGETIVESLVDFESVAMRHRCWIRASKAPETGQGSRIESKFLRGTEVS